MDHLGHNLDGELVFIQLKLNNETLLVGGS